MTAQAGCFAPKPAEYHPRTGSVSPRWSDHDSPSGKVSVALSRGGAVRPGQLGILPDHLWPRRPARGGTPAGDRVLPSSRGSRRSRVRRPAAGQAYRSAVTKRWGERSVAVVLCRPADNLSVLRLLQLDQLAPRLTCPEEGTARGRLVVAGHLHGVVGQGRSKVAAPAGFTVVAVRTRIRQDVHPVVAHLDGEGIGVRVGGDRQEAVGTGIAAAPDLFAVGRCTPQEGEAGIVDSGSDEGSGPAAGDGPPWTPGLCSSPSAPPSATTRARRTGPRRWPGAPTIARRPEDRGREPSRCPRRRSAARAASHRRSPRRRRTSGRASPQRSSDKGRPAQLASAAATTASSATKPW